MNGLVYSLSLAHEHFIRLSISGTNLVCFILWFARNHRAFSQREFLSRGKNLNCVDWWMNACHTTTTKCEQRRIVKLRRKPQLQSFQSSFSIYQRHEIDFRRSRRKSRCALTIDGNKQRYLLLLLLLARSYHAKFPSLHRFSAQLKIAHIFQDVKWTGLFQCISRTQFIWNNNEFPSAQSFDRVGTLLSHIFKNNGANSE